MSTKQITLKSKLFRLKEWLTIPDAARHLSIVFGEEVKEADVLRLALDGHLRLSVNFVNHAYGKCGRLISYDDEENLPPEVLSLFSKLPKESKDIVVSGFKKITNIAGQYPALDDKVTTIEGIWDLCMLCGQQYIIEHEYQMLTGGPEVTSPIVGAAFVVREDGQVCKLHDRFYDHIEYETKQGEKTLEFKNESDRYYPAVSLPSDSLLVVRTQALIDLQEKLAAEDSTGEANPKAKTEITCLNSDHLFYAKELQIAVEAWAELYENNPPQGVPLGGHKKYIAKWLDQNHSDLSERARARISTIINPNQKGGASPTG